MKRLLTILLIIVITFALSSCGNDDKSDDVTSKTFMFHDISFELTSDWNFRTLEEMQQNTQMDFFYDVSRKDVPGFLDEKYIGHEDVGPAIVYCFTLTDPSLSFDVLYSAAKEAETEDFIIKEISVGGKPAVQQITVVETEDGAGYLVEVSFITNGKLYSVYTIGSDNPDNIPWLNEILESISINE